MTVRGALDRGFEVTVLADVTAARRPDTHMDALARMAAAGAWLAQTPQILSELSPDSVAIPAGQLGEEV
jgi:nicotinamidase-related amidase